jgi:hypothetical protein
MPAIQAITARAISFAPVLPVPAAKPVTREGGGRVTLLPDSFQRTGPPSPSATYGRTGAGGS